MRVSRCIVAGLLLLLMGAIFIQTGYPEIPGNNLNPELTPGEKAFLAGKQVRLGVDSARAPFEFIDAKGVYSGISADYIKACAKRIGVSIVLVPGLNVGAAMKKLKNGEIDAISKISPEPERAKDILFTRPYATFASVIVTRQDVRYIGGIDNLDGLRVGVLKGLIVETRMKRDHPDLPLISLPDVRTALVELSSGKIDAFIDNMGIVSYNIEKLGLNNLKIAAQTPYNYDMAFGVRKDWPLLASALDKALAGMSKQERGAITNRWLSVEYQSRVNWKVFGPIAAALSIVIVFVLIWNRRLSRAVSEREAIQTELRQYAQELESRSAVKSHVSQISSALQKTVAFDELAHQFLSYTAPLVGADYGMLYVFDNNEKLLKSAGCYGCIVNEKSFAVGQGPVGQCAFEKAPITITAPSGCDIAINWGMGETVPKAIVLQPVMQTGQVLGVLELAAVTDFGTDALALLDELMPIVAMNIEILNRNLHTKNLLDETQLLAAKLQDQRKLLIDMSQSLPLAIFQLAVSPEGKRYYTFISDKVSEVLGVTAQEIQTDVSARWRHVHPDDLEPTQHTLDKLFERAAKGQTDASGEIIYRVVLDGNVRWALSYACAQHLPEGTVLWNGFYQDITGRKQVEEELKRHIEDLERFSRLTIDREERMIQLKEEVNTLLDQLSKGRKYKIVV